MAQRTVLAKDIEQTPVNLMAARLLWKASWICKPIETAQDLTIKQWLSDKGDTEFVGKRLGILKIIGLFDIINRRGTLKSRWLVQCTECRVLLLLIGRGSGEIKPPNAKPRHCYHKQNKQQVELAVQSGMVFGHLTAIQNSGATKSQRWQCRCVCGQFLFVNAAKLLAAEQNPGCPHQLTT